MSAFAEAVSDGRVVAWRNLKRIPRIPELAIFAILQSIMFVVLFAFVFGGATPLPGGGSYKEYLMPGIYIQTLAFASITTAIGMVNSCASAPATAPRLSSAAVPGALLEPWILVRYSVRTVEYQ